MEWKVTLNTMGLTNKCIEEYHFNVQCDLWVWTFTITSDLQGHDYFHSWAQNWCDHSLHKPFSELITEQMLDPCSLRPVLQPHTEAARYFRGCGLIIPRLEAPTKHIVRPERGAVPKADERPHIDKQSGLAIST